MNSSKKYKDIERISHFAMESQIASFRIEGIKISKKRAQEIRKKIVDDLLQKDTTPNP
ncbi:hypothetical protein [Sinomicrobium sp. M5D2P9]